MKPKDQNYSKSRRLKNQIKAVVTNPYNVIVLVAIVLLTYLIVLPLLDMITTSFTLAQKDARLAGGAAGDFTLYYWQRLLGSSLTKQMLVQPLLNSLLIGVCVSFFAILLGSVLAWLMVRTDLPFKPFFSLAVIIPYMIPSWCKSQAWLTMFKTERIGGAPGFLMSLGINVPDWLAYGPVAIITVLSLHKSGKSADFPDLFFHPRSRKGKRHNQRKTSLPGRSRCGSRAGRFYFIREKYGKSVR